MAEKKKKEILLESGTNELELLEFNIGDRHFGINVAKVVEIMRAEPVVPMPNSNPFVEGIFKPRSEIMTLINLPAYMGLPGSDKPDRDIYIITNFNKANSAFHVHSVDATHRISWDKIEKPDTTIYGGEEGLATGIARIEDRLVTIIDFEKILVDINPSAGIQMSEIDKLGYRSNSEKPIIIAEDSPLLEKMIVESITKAGYSKVTVCSNGKEAWELLQQYKATPLPIESLCALVVTDIEMPQMDGHRLTKLIKTDPELKMIPVIIFSSLINETMYEKGKMLGADAQLSKPEIGNLVKIIDEKIL